MRATTAARITELIVSDVMAQVEDGDMLGVDTDVIDSLIQRDMDALETSVYDGVLAQINAKLESKKSHLIKWWD